MLLITVAAGIASGATTHLICAFFKASPETNTGVSTVVAVIVTAFLAEFLHAKAE